MDNEKPWRPAIIPYVREFEFGEPNSDGVRVGVIDVCPRPVRGGFIAIWGWEESTKVERLRVGNIEQLTGPFPAYVIGPAIYMPEAIKQYHETLKAPFDGYASIEMSTAQVGTRIRIDIFGPVRSAVLFGKTIRS